MQFKITPVRIRIALLIIVFCFIFYFVYLVRSILPPFIIAVIIAYLLNPAVKFIEKYDIPRIYAILFTYLSVALVFAAVAFYIFPLIIREMNAFAQAVPGYTNQIQNYIKNFYSQYRRFEIPESVRQVIDENISYIESILLESLDRLANSVWGIFSSLLSIVIAPILSFYILKDYDRISEKFLNFFPVSFRDEIAEVWNQVDKVLTKFVRGHLLVAGLVGLTTAFGLMLINLKFALLLGLIAGIADLIPYFGPILGAIPAVALALLNSKTQALYVIAVMFIVQQLESNFFSPRILGESVGLHPLVVIFVLLAGGHLFGIIGMVLAVPVTAVARIIANFAVKKITV